MARSAPSPPPSKLPPSRIPLEDVRLIYRNFSGRADRFNEKGNRNFNVILTPELTELLGGWGFNVRCPTPTNPEYEPICVLKIQVKYRARDGRVLRPPRIILITSRGKTHLDEESIELLDTADIVNVDMYIRPWEFEPGRYSAYLDSIYVTIREDPLEMKYLDIPEGALPLAEDGEGDTPF